MDYIFIVLNLLLLAPLLGHDLLCFHLFDCIEFLLPRERSMSIIFHLLAHHQIIEFGISFLIVIKVDLLLNLILNLLMVNHQP